MFLQVTAMSAGSLGADNKDTLFVGSQTHFLAYDVHNNSDLFYRYRTHIAKLGLYSLFYSLI